jgi:hypothetical protein
MVVINFLYYMKRFVTIFKTNRITLVDKIVFTSTQICIQKNTEIIGEKGILLLYYDQLLFLYSRG